MLEFLIQLDYRILKFLNVDLASPFMDDFWTVVTHSERYMPIKVLLAVLVLWAFSIYKLKLIRLLLVLVVAVGLTDLLSYRVVKQLVDRPRPFQNAAISSWLRHVGDAQGPSFPSNHAANTTAGAVVLAAYFPRRRYLFYIIALLVALSRPALGVHYPSDVLAGSLLGCIVGLTVCSFFLGGWRERFGLTVKGGNKSNHSGGWRARVRRLEDS